MYLSVSDLGYGGFRHNVLAALPSHIGIEIFNEFGSDVYWKHVLAKIMQHKRVGLSFHGPCVATNLADLDNQVWLESFDKTIDLAKCYQAKFVVVHTNEGYTAQSFEVKRTVEKRLDMILTYANEKEVPIVIENVGLSIYGNNLYPQQEYIDLLNSFPTAYALLDIGHAYINNWNILEVVEKLQSRILGYHLHDNDGDADAHMVVGQGKIPWSSLLPAISKATPEACAVLEYAHSMKLETLEQHIQKLQELYLT